MIGASKILTVSYGTFSCTLEGFDEPFNTMKAIAEYFRDLAADDRYFGAEPPTPDAAMLHRIAEREIQRKVEAKIQDNGVILRAADLAAPAPHPEPRVRPAPSPQPAGLLAEESVAAKLQRIRAAVSRATPPVAAPIIAAAVEDAVFAEDEHADEVALMPAVPAVADTFSPAPYDEEVDVAFSAPQDDDAAPPAWEYSAAAEDDQPEAEAASTPEQDQPEVLADVTSEEDDALIASLTAASFVTDDAEVMASLDDDIEDEDMSDLQALDGQPQWEAEPEYEATPEPQEWPQEVVASGDATVQAEDDAFEYLDEAETPSAEFQAEIEAPVSVTEEADAWPTDPEAEEPVATPAAEKLRRARARVIKVRRPDADAAETSVDAPVIAAPVAASLTAEEEAELQRELDAVELEAESGRQTEREGRTILEASTTGDEAVNRLLRQTNTEMDGPENRRRMSTLAHLKAAVAATVAELRSPGTHAENGETSRLDRYRADLARVVRPRRPGAASDKDRPAPLVLVSEQRIDAQKVAPATDGTAARILPRRVTSGNLALNPDADTDDAETQPDAENIFVSSKSFAEFAERLGASELPDLLEAAAAYTACIEGRPHFSRPHLMRYIAEMSEDSEVAREDGLRSFGQLLRQGKIEKVKRGQFAITDNSYYLAEARRMIR